MTPMTVFLPPKNNKIATKERNYCEDLHPFQENSALILSSWKDAKKQLMKGITHMSIRKCVGLYHDMQ